MHKEDLENILFWGIGGILAFFWIGYGLNPIELVQTGYSKIVNYINSDEDINDNLSIEETQKLLKDNLNVTYDKEYIGEIKKTAEELAQEYYKNNPDRAIELSDDDWKLLDTARQLASNNKFNDAKETITILENKYPTSPSVLIVSSHISCSLGEYSQGIRTLESIIDYPAANKGLGVCYFMKKDYGKAGFYIYRALKIMPEDITLQQMRDKIINY